MTKKQTEAKVKEAKANTIFAMVPETKALKGKKLEAVAMDICPRTAAVLLGCMDLNRKERPRRTLEYTRKMAGKLWKENGESITFDRSGRLINGQHRLRAIQNSGNTYRIVVALNAEPASFETFDLAARRTPSDVLSIHKVDNYSDTASTVQALYRLERGWLKSGYTIGPDEIWQAYNHYPNISDALRYGAKSKPVFPSKAKLNACCYLFMEYDRGKAIDFMEGLVKGELLGPKSPILVARNQLHGMRVSDDVKYTDQFFYTVIFKAFADFCEGKDRRGDYRYNEDENFVKSWLMEKGLFKGEVRNGGDA